MNKTGACLGAFVPLIIFSSSAQQLKSRPELTNYEQTSRYDDVIQFFTELQQRSPLVRLETFGHSHKGRPLPLVILANPPVTSAQQSRDSTKPTVFILANIHAGEVEGKEAAQILARRLALEDLRPLLDKLIVLIAPIYNADGNEQISLTNRVEQNGPIGGVGKRENAQGFDLNRDFIKIEAPETDGLIRLLNEWDPLVTVDLHTTDGSYHGYHLTYSIPLNPSLDSRLTDYHRDKLMPALTTAMLRRHQFRTYYYGNFSDAKDAPPGLPQPAWFTFSPQPRVGFNYFGFRNRLGILSEAYSYLDFLGRIEVTEAFVQEILRFTAGHAGEIRRLTQRVERESVERARNGPLPRIGVAYKPKALAHPVEMLVGEVTHVTNPLSGRQMTAMVQDKFKPVKMPDYGLFEATRKVSIASAYLFRPDDRLSAVREKLLAHGIKIAELNEPKSLQVEAFEIQSVDRNKRTFQGHHETSLKGQFQTKTVDFPKGTFVVTTAQPLGLLAAYLLEPESEDGLVTWNFLDACLGPGRTYPIFKLVQPAKALDALLLSRK